MSDDPERLLAEALRAQAARTPLPPAAVTRYPSTPPGGYSGYGLLSGTDVDLSPTAPAPEEVTLAAGTIRSTSRIEPPRRVPVPAILLLAVALGLAAGAVAGLLTLL